LKRAAGQTNSTPSAAARERNVPVSQVTRALARLEAACGARLLHRSTHGLSLTDEGATVLAHGRRLLDTTTELQGELSGKTGGPAGWVRISVSSVLAQAIIAPGLSALHQRHPGLHLDIAADDRMADMARDGIDIAIRTIALPDTMVARRIGTLGRALYAAPDYAARAGLPEHPEGLRAHRLIVNTAATQLNVWPFVVDGKAWTFAAEGFWRTNDTGLAANLVLQGLGIGRLATIAAEPLVRQGRLIPVLPQFVDIQTVPIFAVVAATRQRLPKIGACVDYWIEWIAENVRPAQ
jgi:DNA-binding transcriptional LysR family regulator